jgi:ABC-type oligopeptide transport system substrate-binding subunit
MRNQWPVLSVATGLAAGLLAGCGSQTSDTGSTGSSLVMGMSDDVLATDPASGYDPGSWLLFDNVFQSLLSFPDGATEPAPEAAKECAFSEAQNAVEGELDVLGGEGVTVAELRAGTTRRSARAPTSWTPSARTRPSSRSTTTTRAPPR